MFVMISLMIYMKEHFYVTMILLFHMIKNVTILKEIK